MEERLAILVENLVDFYIRILSEVFHQALLIVILNEIKALILYLSQSELHLSFLLDFLKIHLVAPFLKGVLIDLDFKVICDLGANSGLGRV